MLKEVATALRHLLVWKTVFLVVSASVVGVMVFSDPESLDVEGLAVLLNHLFLVSCLRSLALQHAWKPQPQLGDPVGLNPFLLLLGLVSVHEPH